MALVFAGASGSRLGGRFRRLDAGSSRPWRAGPFPGRFPLLVGLVELFEERIEGLILGLAGLLGPG